MELFIAMKRGMHDCESPGDDQRHINQEFDTEARSDCTVKLERWEKFITKLESQFIPKDPKFMIDNIENEKSIYKAADTFEEKDFRNIPKGSNLMGSQHFF